MASTEVGQPSRWQRIARSLTAAEWRRAAALVLVIAVLHVVGFGLLIFAIAPQELSLGSGAVFGVGLGITAYTLGMRHAFDADHIGAIDNVTRKLMTDGQRPLSVGFFFSLGHSTIVFGLAILLSVGIRGLSGAVESDSSTLKSVTGLIGPSVSGFLPAAHRHPQPGRAGQDRQGLRPHGRGAFDEQQLEDQLNSRGFMNRFLGRATRAITQPWQMYPLGVLFGLGFDTATEIALLATAGSAAAASGIPLDAILCLPILFAAGMSLLDTIDGAFMNFAYGWLFAKPVRKVFYNITITALSVAVALLIGTIELVAVFSDRLSLTGGVFEFVSSIDLNYVGYAVAALFMLTWIFALAVWRFGRIEEKWSATLQPSEP